MIFESKRQHKIIQDKQRELDESKCEIEKLKGVAAKVDKVNIQLKETNSSLLQTSFFYTSDSLKTVSILSATSRSIGY